MHRRVRPAGETIICHLLPAPCTSTGEEWPYWLLILRTISNLKHLDQGRRWEPPWAERSVPSVKMVLIRNEELGSSVVSVFNGCISSVRRKKYQEKKMTVWNVKVVVRWLKVKVLKVKSSWLGSMTWFYHASLLCSGKRCWPWEKEWGASACVHVGELHRRAPSQ